MKRPVWSVRAPLAGSQGLFLEGSLVTRFGARPRSSLQELEASCATHFEASFSMTGGFHSPYIAMHICTPEDGWMPVPNLRELVEAVALYRCGEANAYPYLVEMW